MLLRNSIRTKVAGAIAALVVLFAINPNEALADKTKPNNTSRSESEPYQLRIKTGTIGVSSRDKVSVRIAHVAGQRKIAVRVWFFDESGNRLNNSPVEVHLRPKRSSSFDLDVATLSGSPPKMVRAVVHAVGSCGKNDRSSSLIVHTERQTASNDFAETASVCPVMLCSDQIDSNSPTVEVANDCILQYN